MRDFETHFLPFAYAPVGKSRTIAGSLSGRLLMALLCDRGSVALMCQASDGGRSALDPLQETILANIAKPVIDDPDIHRFVGNACRAVMLAAGYELDEDGVLLPAPRRIWLKRAARYRRIAGLPG